MIDRTNIEYVVIEHDSVCLYAKNKLMEAALTLRFGEPLSIIENNRSWIVTLDEAKALWYEADQEQNVSDVRKILHPMTKLFTLASHVRNLSTVKKVLGLLQKHWR